MSVSSHVMEKRKKAAAEFDRPLLLTPSQDWVGYVLSRLGRALLFLVTAVSVLAVLLIFIFIVRESLGYFTKGQSFWSGTGLQTAWHRLLELLGSARWYPEAGAAPEFGALAIVIGSLYVTVVALLVAVPVGLLAAVYLSDITSFRVREIVKPVVELLAAIPSVAYGFFAIKVVAPFLQDHLGFSTGTNALNSSIILALMAIPTIVSVSEDALTALGRDLREASYALGATRAETIVKVVLPAAHNGVIAAVILGMMRAVGETMVVWMASGNANRIPAPWWDLSQSVRTLTATVAGDMGETAKGSDHYHALFALGLVLLLFTFGLNLVTEYFLRRVRRISGGKGA